MVALVALVLVGAIGLRPAVANLAETNLTAIAVLRTAHGDKPPTPVNASRTDKGSAAVLRLRGTARFLTGDSVGALPDLAAAADQQPNNQLGRFWLAEARASAGLDAAADYRAAGALPYLLALASQSWTRGDCVAVDHYATLAADAFPSSAEAHYLGAQAAECEGKSPEAIAAYLQAAMAGSDNRWTATVAAGDVARLEHRDGDAIAAYRQAIAVTPSGGSTRVSGDIPYARLAELLLATCTSDGTQQVIEAGLAYFPGDTWLLTVHSRPLPATCPGG